MNGGLAVTRRLRAGARRHSFSFFSSLGAMMRHRVGTLMTVLVLGIAMLLPMGLYICLANLDRLELNEEEWAAITVFLEDGAGATQAQALADALRTRADVAAVDTISPQQGLDEFRAASGFGPALDALGENPLPWVLSVTPVASDAQMEARVTELLAHISAQEGVESASYDFKWLQRLGRLLELGRAAVMVLTLLFAVAVVVVVANTIRLDVAARAEEIEVLSLVGAPNGFIRLPFLYSGFWYGLLGGVVAMVLVNLALEFLDRPLGRLLDSYGARADIVGLDGTQTLLLLAGGGLLGLAGAVIAVQRYLRLLRVDGMLGRR